MRGWCPRFILITSSHKTLSPEPTAFDRCSPALPTSTRASAVGERAAGGGGGLGLGGSLGLGGGVARPPAWFTGGWLPVPPGEGAAGGGTGRAGPAAGAVAGGGAAGGGSAGGEAGAFKGRGQTLGAQGWGRCAGLLGVKVETYP